MARVPRCLVDDVDAERPRLDRATRHHLQRVLRLRTGAPLELVDGRGGLARARWTGDETPEVESRRPRRAPPPDPVRLAVAPPRPSRLDWLVEKAAELGAAEVLLLRTTHAAREVGAARVERLQRKADEALLQSRRLGRTRVTGPLDLSAVLARAGTGELWLAEPPGDDGDDPHETTPGGAPPPDRRRDTPLLVLVGPEGGFTGDERAAATGAGARGVRLGTGVLRVETAALALLVLAAAAARR